MIVVPSNTAALAPPNSQVTNKGFTVSSGSTTVNIAAHIQGDLIVIGAFRRNCTAGNDAAPTVPAGWTTLSSLSSIAAYGYTTSFVLAKMTASAAGTTSGTWTNATDMISMVFRGQGVTGTSKFVGAGSYTNLGGPTGSTSVPQYPCTMNDNTGKSVVPYVICTSSTVTVSPTTPAGWTRSGTSTWLKPFSLTNTAVTSFSTPAMTFSAGTSYTGFCFEVVGY